MYDVAIIGKGPAGTSAAIYLSRSGLKTVIIANGYGSLEKAEKIENYYGIPSISGKDLIDIGVNQAKMCGTIVIDNEVVGIEKSNNFTLELADASYIESRSVLLAMGRKRESVSVQNVDRFDGKGISYCAICDGFLYRGKKLAVLGSGDYAYKEASVLKNFSKNVIILTNGDKPCDKFISDDSFEIITDKISAFFGDERLGGVCFENGDEVCLDGVFIALGVAGATDFAKKVGVFCEKGNIKIDSAFQTNVQGLFAAGDCIGGFLQVSKAVGDGACASVSMIKYLKENI